MVLRKSKTSHGRASWRGGDWKVNLNSGQEASSGSLSICTSSHRRTVRRKGLKGDVVIRLLLTWGRTFFWGQTVALQTREWSLLYRMRRWKSFRSLKSGQGKDGNGPEQWLTFSVRIVKKKSVCLGFLKISTKAIIHPKIREKTGREQVFYNTLKTHFIIHASPDFTVFACNCVRLFFLKKHITSISPQYNSHICLSWLWTCLWCL